MKRWTKFDHFTAACWCVLGVATLVRLSLGFWFRWRADYIELRRSYALAGGSTVGPVE